MKTLIIMLLSVTLSLGVSAQRKGYYSGFRPVYRPHVYVAPFSYGLGFGYPSFGYPYYGNPYAYPNLYRQMPYKLELQIESIRDDYQNRIKLARKDRSLRHGQKKLEIRNLKTQRDQEIIDAKRDYSRSPRTNNNVPSIDNS